MKPTQQTCDPQRVADYLDEQLEQSARAEFEAHLSDCEICRQELQQRAAEPDVWRDAAELLGAHSGYSSLPTTTDGESHRRSALSVLETLAPTDDPEMLGRIGDYEVSGVVGIGGMGAVLKGFDKSLRRVVAIKVMAPHLADSGSARVRFQREARAAAAITHDNVIDTYGVSEANGLPYLVMPFARGPSLQKRIDESGPLTAIEIVRIGRQIAAGLAAAHEQGLVHRDIKPANILLNEGIERLWITDFGVARAMDDASMTRTGVIAGTPQYMSPEQARGEFVDHRSDLFSLGSILYTACTGRPPFRSEAAYGILRRITDTDPRPIREINPDIPEWLCRVIDRLMAKHPADRFETADEVAGLFESCLAHLQQPTLVALPPSVTVHADVSGTSGPKTVTQTNSQTASKSKSLSRTGVFLMASTVLAVLSFAAIQLTAAVDISGEWKGETWPRVSLSTVQEASNWYTGTFTNSQGQSGAIQLEWSRLQRRYNGRWKAGDGQSGSISLRANKHGAIIGAIQLDADASVDKNTARLREIQWQRFVAGDASKKKTKERSVGVDGPGRPSSQSPFLQAEAEKTKPVLRVYQLNSANIAEVAKTLSAIYSGCVVNEDARNKRLHIQAPAAVHDAIASDIQKLDVLSAADKQRSVTTPDLSSSFGGRGVNSPTLLSDLESRLRTSRRSIRQREDALAEARDQFVRLKSVDTTNSRKSDFLLQTTERQLPALEAALKSAKADLADAEAQLDTTIELLEIQLTAAEKGFEQVTNLVEQLRIQFEAGELAVNDVLEAESRATESESAVKQLKVLLRYYKKLESSPAKNEARDDETDTNNSAADRSR